MPKLRFPPLEAGVALTYTLGDNGDGDAMSQSIRKLFESNHVQAIQEIDRLAWMLHWVIYNVVAKKDWQQVKAPIRKEILAALDTWWHDMWLDPQDPLPNSHYGLRYKEDN